MVSLRRYLIYLLFALILALALPACVRPLGQSEVEQADQDAQEAEEVQAEESSDTGEEVDEAEIVTEETAPEETEGENAEAIEESQEAVSSEPDVGSGTPETEEEVPTGSAAETEEVPAAEEGAEGVDIAESETEMSEDTAEGATEEGETLEEGMVEEAAAEEEAVEETAAGEELAEEAEAGESMAATLPSTHTVAPGENLFRIGLKYGLSWIPLAIYNGISNPNLVYTGQVIRIPGGQTPPTQTLPEGVTETDYVVKPGDTLFKISRSFGVNPEEIARVNGLVNPNLIYSGQVLKIPVN